MLVSIVQNNYRDVHTTMIIIIVLLYDKQYHAFYVIKDNRGSQLSCVNWSYSVLLVIIDRKGRLCAEEFTYFTVANWTQ